MGLWFTVAVGTVVALIWTASMIIQLAAAGHPGGYTTPLEVHGLMGTVVGALYTQWRIERNRK